LKAARRATAQASGLCGGSQLARTYGDWNQAMSLVMADDAHDLRSR
jgi:hypothetical protein